MQRNVVEHADHRDGRRRRNRPSFGFVVETHVTADDWRVECERSIAQPLHPAHELPHYLRTLRISVVETVRDSGRTRTRACNVAARLAARAPGPAAGRS